MRTLVEQTAESVGEWFGRLVEVCGETLLPRPDDVHVLIMGGVDGGAWIETPERPVVIVGTQDMLRSRALMRGYASSQAVGRWQLVDGISRATHPWP